MQETPPVNTTDIMHRLGVMQGEATANFAAMFLSLEQTRTEIRQVEERTQVQIKRLEDNTNSRFAAVDGRINTLEDDNKQQIRDIARQGAISGSIAAALVSGAVEFIKRL